MLWKLVLQLYADDTRIKALSIEFKDGNDGRVKGITAVDLPHVHAVIWVQNVNNSTLRTAISGTVNGTTREMKSLAVAPVHPDKYEGSELSTKPLSRHRFASTRTCASR